MTAFGRSSFPVLHRPAHERKSNHTRETPRPSIIAVVKRLFILLLIVLLPLRGWAGDLMGVQMATSGLAAGAMPADCAMKAMHAPAAADEESAGPANADGCTSCDLCLPMAELPSLRFDVFGFVAHAAPPTGGEAFFSASPRLALKPPNS
jgi:hypothetical protein